MKILTLTIILLFFITGCSMNEQKFNCEGTGLVISKSKAIYGFEEFYFCKKDGVKNIFHSDNKMCDTNTNFKDYFIFDEVSYGLIIMGPLNSHSTKDCKKIELDWF